MSYTPISGRFGSVTVGSTVHKLRSWTITPTVDILDATPFSETADGNGLHWRRKMTGLAGAKISIEGIFDSGNNPYAASQLVLGSTVALTLGIKAPFSFSCSAIVSSVPVTSNVEQEIKFSCELEADGAVTFPAAGS